MQTRQMYPNFYPHLDGGGLEQAGAVGVLNEMLLATDPRDGHLEFFPLWPHGEAASFVSLRAKGAYVCSGSVDADGMVGEVVVVAERTGAMTFAAPESWGRVVPRVTALTPQGGGGGGGGRPVHVEAVGDGVFRVTVAAGGRYMLNQR
eukprot:COSAG01_NODE_1004_length_12197_cov_8.942718_2_plen_148_part_00